MALSDDDVALIVASVPEPIGDDAATWVSDLCFAIEAEVQAQDEALIRQLVEALEYHRAQTRPIDRTDQSIAAGRAWLEGKP